jgi:hypothetical protein
MLIMPSHFSTIGLPLQSEEEFVTLANELAAESVRFDVPGGYYLCWSSASGAELWIQVDAEDALIGMNPHFSGESRVRAGLVRRITRPGGSPLDGAFGGWAPAPGDDPEQGSYPFVFDAPDFQCDGALTLPSIAEVQVAAFVHELSVYRSEEDYMASQSGELKFAAESFIPSGLFQPGGQSIDPPEAHAIFAGRILEAEMRMNELTNRPFQWVLVKTLGGVFDVVADPEFLESRPRPGGILSGSFWLSGRLLI